MIKFIDLKGLKFGKLMVIKFDHRDGTNYYWLCKCECGNERIVCAGNLRSDHSRSCGCLKREESIKRFKNKPLSLKHREKLRKSHIGHKVSKETKRKMKENSAKFWFKKHLSEKHRKRIGEENKGKKLSEKSIKKRTITRSLNGWYKNPEEQKRRMKQNALRGEKHHWWKGGITPINELIRKSIEYKLWRKTVFIRDNYTCVWCGRKDKTIKADHIKPFALYPELRFAIDNGRTLCDECHKTTDTYGVNGKNTRQELKELIRR